VAAVRRHARISPEDNIMRPNPKYASTDAETGRRLIRENPWGVIVSANDGDIVASHYPIMLDENSEELAVFTHVGRPDEELHRFGDSGVLLIVQGQHGYISPSWYAPGATRVPTWNFLVAHCYGVPEVLGEEENLITLTRLVEHFERHVDEPMLLDQEYGAKLAKGTVGIRLPIDRFICKIKMSNEEDPVTQRRVIENLRRPGPYEQPALAHEMERALGQTSPER
jgi:transcriptional regulator